MKKFLLTIIAALVVLLSSCPNPDNSDNPNKPANPVDPNKPVNPIDPNKKTMIVFDNADGICTATVYQDYRRRNEDIIAEIPSGDSSNKIEWPPGVLVPFYLSYTISLKGAGGFTMNYVPREVGKDQVAARIEAGATTVITIPKLEETVSSPNDLLSNSSYLLIKNNSSSSFQLHDGTGPISPENSSTSTVNSGKEAWYKINPWPAASYRLLAGADYIQFPDSAANFQAGCLYSFIFDGGVSAVSEIEIKLENVAPAPGPGLFRGDTRIGRQNLAGSLAWISANAVNGDNFYIMLGADENSPSNTLNYSGKTVGITLLGYGGIRTVTLNANGSLFTVASGVTLTLDENITLKGRSANNSSLVFINNGKLIVNDGAKITGNAVSASVNDVYSGGVTVFGINAGFTMNGGEISGNTVSASGSAANSRGGGVYVDSGNFTMNGGKIYGNSVSSSASILCLGGGVCAYGTFTMNGGEISGNSVSSSGSFGGGGVYVHTDEIFTMNGGKISGNTARTGSSGFGGGVLVAGTFIMEDDGEISGNTACWGGGVAVLETFAMYGGRISGNTAYGSGGGVYVAYGSFAKTGGTITGYADDMVNGNVVKNNSGVVQSNNGHAAYIDFDTVEHRENTAGPEDNLDSDVSGTAGGWL